MEDDTLAITANWDGSDQFPNCASMLFSNGDLYEGEIVNGQPTNKGIWTNIREEEESGFVKSLKKANEYYEAHRKTIDRAVMITSVVLVAVTVVASAGSAAPALVGVSSTLKSISKVANVANEVLNTADAITSIVSSSVDGDWATAAVEVAINAAFIAAPKVAPLLKKPARKVGIVLSKAAKTAAKPLRIGVVKISKSKAFKKIVTITRKDGALQKTICKASKKQVRESAKKPAKKFESKYLKSLMNKTLINKKLEQILAKGPIKLTKKELELLKNEPWQLNEIIKKYAGDEKNFQEFFIRLSKGDMAQAKSLLDDKAIWNNIRDKIRPGGYHEWLMTSNFTDFLTNPKWGNDGPYLCLALTDFVQRTETVLFKTGGGHVSKQLSSSEARKASVAFHNGLSQVISQCSSKEELFSAVRKYAKEQLTEESYKEFEQVLIKVLS